MRKTPIILDFQQANRLFPFHFIVDANLTIISASDCIIEVFNITNNCPLNSFFRIQNSFSTEITFDQILKFNEQEIHLITKEAHEYSLKGHFEIISSESEILFIGNIAQKSKHLAIQKEINEIEKNTFDNQTSGIGSLQIDNEGLILWSNDNFAILSGFDNSEILGKSPITLFSGTLTNKLITARIIKAFNSGEIINEEVVFYKKDGTNFWAKIKAQPSTEFFQNCKCYYAIFEDITKDKMAKDDLLKSEKRLKTLISNLHTGILFEDENRNIVITNHKFCSMFGIHQSPQSIIGYDSEALLIQRQFLFQKPEHYSNRVKQIVKDKKLVVDETIELIDGRILSRDYLPIFIEKEYKGHLWTYNDITIKKNSEMSLRIREEKYRGIIANMNLGLVEVDLLERILFANQCFCEMSGYEYEELIESTTLDLFIKGEYISLLKQQNENRKKGESDTYEIAVKNKRGELKWWLISGAPRLNEKGEIVGTIGIFLDITQQKELETDLIEARKQAEESSKAKESFLANMSHEIRTPLNAIIGMVRELSRNTDDNKQNAYLNNAETAAKHLLSIINNILDISKIEAGEFQLEKNHFSLQNVINETVTIVSVNAKEKELDLEVDINKNLEFAHIGDDSRIRQILINLIGNAIKFTEKGKISISCNAENIPGLMQKITLSIKDTGIGMNALYLQKIFNKFSQEDKSIARKFGGTGLGMAITHELVHLMDGKMDVSSQKDVGTTISIELSLKIGDIRKTQSAPEKLDFNNLKNIKILLVEDNEWNRLVAVNSLSLYDIKPIEAMNGIEAIEAMKKEQFDIVLMDLQMPIMDGIEATRIIREELKLQTPIIALTANALKKEIDYCLANGFNDFIIKPFEESTFFSVILKSLNINTVGILKTPTTVPEIPLPDNELYSLEKLIEASRGNEWFVKKMINVFIEQTTSSIELLKNAFEVKDFKSVKEIAHRIKPSIDNMSINSIKQEIREIEKMALEDPNSPMLEELLIKVNSILRRVVADLSKN